MTNKLQRLVNKIVLLPYWWMLFALFLFVWTVQVNPPLNREELRNGIWGIQILQSKNLLNNDFLNNIMYGYNRAYRLTYPVIAQLLNLSNPTQLYKLQLLFGLFFQILLVKVCLNVSKNNIIGTILFGFICSFYYFSNTAPGDTFGHGDMVAFLLIIITLYTKNPIIIFISLLAAFFSNERTLMVGLPTIITWWILDKDNKKKIQLWIAILTAVIVYYFIRHWLAKQPNFKAIFPNDMGFYYLIKSHSFFNIYIFTFGGLWPLFFFWIYKLKRIPIAVLAILFFSASAFIVADQTRGISFMFPLFLIAFREAHYIADTQKINQILLYSAIMALFIPNFVFFGEYAFRPSLFYHLFEINIIDPINNLIPKLLK